MAKNDSRIKQSFENKTLGGYISIENTNDENDENDKNEDIEFKYNMIYDSFGILQNGKEIWMKQLEKVKKYIDTYNKKPSVTDKTKEIKKVAEWLANQKINYKSKENIMKNKEIYDKWTSFINDPKYEQYFISNEDAWINILEEIKQYIHTNNKKPSYTDKDKEIKQLGYWISRQQEHYKKKDQIMKNKEIYDKWTVFINSEKYKKYFMSNEDIWLNNLKELENYINKNNKRPSSKDENKDIKFLGCWISTQSKNYNKNENIMNNKEIYNKWTEFINDQKYKKYF